MAGETFAFFLTEDPNTTDLVPPLLASDLIAVVRGDAPGEVTYRAPASMLGPITYSYEQPATGATLTATEGLGAFVCDPAGAIAVLDVVMPPTPADGQMFEVSTTEDITALTATAPGSATVRGGGPFTLAGNGGLGWRYVAVATSWIRRW